MCSRLEHGRRARHIDGVFLATSLRYLFRVTGGLDSASVTSARKTTDIYLADLAASRGWRFATLDAGIAHPVVDLIPELPRTAPVT
jgi:hypothetical protein